MKSLKTLQVLNILGFILVLVVNILAVTLPIGGNSTGEIADLYPNLFVPAGYAFSIWSLIYILLLVFIILQSKGLFSSKEKPDFVEMIGWWFFISCLANSSWIIAWHYLLPGLSVFLMLLILFSLIRIYQLLGVNYSISEQPLMVRLTFSVYLGWISVATIANITAFLVSTGWTGGPLSEVIWTVIMLGVATVLGVIFLWKYKDLAYGAVLLWAFWAIRTKRIAIANPDEHLIPTMVLVYLSVLIVVALGRYLVFKK